MEKFRPNIVQKSRGIDGDIQEEIERLYYDGYDFHSSTDLMMKYDRIVANKMGTVEKTSDDRYVPSLSSANIMCYFFLKYAKDNKKYLIKTSNGKRRSAISKKLSKIIGYVLADGIYYAEVGRKTFLVLFVQSSDFSTIDTRIYFIGKKYAKYQKEFLKLEKELAAEFKDQCGESTIVEIGQYGNVTTTVNFKPFDKMIFRDKDKIIEYIDNWKKNIPVYYDKYKMIPKLSILLYGKPGTGKSTFYQALADHFKINRVNCIQLGYFKQKRYTTTDPAIYALDDLDTFAQSREPEKDAPPTGHQISNDELMSNILAFLDHPPTFNFNNGDGVYYPVSIVVATTNYIDKLDPAIKRYGRFDLHIEMSDFDYELSKKFTKLYNIDLDNIIDVSDKETFNISPAKLQALCMENIDKQLKEV